jgi:hypothetical protein
LNIVSKCKAGHQNPKNSRPIPFALHKGVREQIEEMISDSVIEELYSSYVNPITLVQKEGRRVRICLHAREVNKFMTPDRAKVPPMHMLLQRFHGGSYISTLHLSSAFLQIPLEKVSRKWTDFQFQNKVYQIHTGTLRVPEFPQCFYQSTSVSDRRRHE